MIVITGKTKPITLYFYRNTTEKQESYGLQLTKGNKTQDIVPSGFTELQRFVAMTLDLSAVEDGEYTYHVTPSGETGLMQIINIQSKKTYKQNEEYRYYKG